MSKKRELKRIVQYLMLHGSAIPNIGLLNGKLGISIFFFHYEKCTGNRAYKMLAEDLIDEIYKKVNLNTSFHFDNGLAGIAWGVEYLVRNQFLEANTDEVLMELDEQIMERDVRRVSSTSLERGIKGIGYYALARCGNGNSLFGATNRSYLTDLLCAFNKIPADGEIIFLTSQLKGFMDEKELPQSDFFLKKLIRNVQVMDNSIWEKQHPIGIANNGFTGIALKLIQELYEK